MRNTFDIFDEDRISNRYLCSLGGGPGADPGIAARQAEDRRLADEERKKLQKEKDARANSRKAGNGRPNLAFQRSLIGVNNPGKNTLGGGPGEDN